MKNLYIIVLIILLAGSVIFVSCTDCQSLGGTDCTVETHCETDTDCKNTGVDDQVCVNGACHMDFCKDFFCGVGTCIHNDNPLTTDIKEVAYCQCDENSLPYEFNNKIICTSKCEYHSDCNPEGLGVCIKGQCDETNYCDTADDCPDGDICDYNICKPKPIEE